MPRISPVRKVVRPDNLSMFLSENLYKALAGTWLLIRNWRTGTDIPNHTYNAQYISNTDVIQNGHMEYLPVSLLCVLPSDIFELFVHFPIEVFA